MRRTRGHGRHVCRKNAVRALVPFGTMEAGSDGSAQVVSETTTSVTRLAPSDQNTAWVTGSSPSRPNSTCGRSGDQPNGLGSSSSRPNRPAATAVGTTSVSPQRAGCDGGTGSATG